MRRTLLVLVGLVAVGLLSAKASTFSVDAEDVESFRSPVVSISTPPDPTSSTSTTNPCPPLPSPILLRTLTGPKRDVLHPADMPYPAVEGEEDRAVPPSVGVNIREQSNPSRYVTWSVQAPAPCGYRVKGVVRLFLRTVMPPSTRPELHVELYLCDASAPPESVSQCASAMGGWAGTVPEFGDTVTQLNLGMIDVTVPAGKDLRLKAIYHRSATFVGSTPRMKWGVTSPDVDEVSRLTVTP